MCLDSLQCVADTSEYYNSKIQHLSTDNQKLDSEVKGFQWATSNLKRDIEKLTEDLNAVDAKGEERHELYMMIAIGLAVTVVILIITLIIQCCQIKKMKFIRYRHY
jgi:hypothetical protein